MDLSLLSDKCHSSTSLTVSRSAPFGSDKRVHQSAGNKWTCLLWLRTAVTVPSLRLTVSSSSPSSSSPQSRPSASTTGRIFPRGRCIAWTPAGCVSAAEEFPSAPRQSARSWTVKTSTFPRANVALSASVRSFTVVLTC